MAVFDTIQFEITEQHIKLIENMYFEFYDWVEFGAPGVDPKRPYGNSDVYNDMAEILSITPAYVDEDDPTDIEFSDDQYALMDRLHKETAQALQIIVRTKSFEPGTYEAEEYSDNWRRAEKQ